MQPLYNKFSDYIKTLNSREKVLVLLVAIAVVYAIWDYFIFNFVNTQHEQYEAEIKRTESDLVGIDQQLANITAEITANGTPNLDLKANIATIEQEIKQTEERLAKTFESLVPPKEVTNFIRSLLLENNGLELIALKNDPVQVINLKEDAPGSNDSSESARLYQHATNIKLEGDYISLHEYLSKLEQSKWTLYWDQLEYKVTTYPKAEITLRVYTLSTTEYWLGL
jgi:MSHA biogenesis protein MshJ